MAYAVELRLDGDASHAVSELWSAIDRAGETSLGSARVGVPHVSLAVFDTLDQRRIEGALAVELTGALRLELILGSLGFFFGPTTVAFLGVAPSASLLEAHRAVLGALAAGTEGLWRHYRADALVPHCTLAMAVRDPAVVAGSVSGRLPIEARVAGAALVEVRSGRVLLAVGGTD